MSWLRSSPLRHNASRHGGAPTFLQAPISTANLVNAEFISPRTISAATECDPRACYDSFCKHWQQAYEVIQRAASPQCLPSHDDVLGVVSHLDFMVTLLLVELHNCNRISLSPADDLGAVGTSAPCLEFLLSENLLDKLYKWGCRTGRYANAVRLEQLKLYELLVSHSRHQLLCHEPFLRPLLKLLGSSQGELFPPDLEKRLVVLLNQLCVVLMQNVHLLDLFFFSAQAQQQERTHQLTDTTNFIIFSLLIPYVHREGSLGHQARDALLLCMSLSQKNSNVGTYIAEYSSMCPLLVTGLGGLYSRLPNSIDITPADWHRITPDDVTSIPELTLFMNSLEFCNAVVQVAHDMIRQQLLDLMYQGFIVPVLGPALLQINSESQISAMSYLDLILRSVTEPSLLRLFIKLLFDNERFDGERIIDALIERMHSPAQNVCVVVMALFDTLLALHCEDVMLELLLKYLLPGKHVPISHRHKINKIDPYNCSAEFFLEFTPEVMKRARELTKHKNVAETVNSTTTHQNLPSPTTTMSKTIGANWNYYGMYTGDSLYANTHAYLFDAHYRIAKCQSDCDKWANSYNYQKSPKRAQRNLQQAIELAKQYFAEFSVTADVETVDRKQPDSLQSIGESSGYESFRWRAPDDESNFSDISTNLCDSELETSNRQQDNTNSNQSSKKEPWRISNSRDDLLPTDFDFSQDIFTKGTATLGPFINAIWGKLQTFTSNSVYVNLHLTGLITRLAWYPLPLVHSLLLRTDIVITSDTPSFHQVLRILKQQIDAELPVTEESLEIIDIARSCLIDREFRLMNARKANESAAMHTAGHATSAQQRTTFSSISASTPMHASLTSAYDPFKRNDSKRKSISKSISSIFGRKSSLTSAAMSQASSGASSGLSQIYAFFTGAASALVNTAAASAEEGSNSSPKPQHLRISESMCETSLSTVERAPFNNQPSGNITLLARDHENELTASGSSMATVPANLSIDSSVNFTTSHGECSALVQTGSVSTMFNNYNTGPISLESLTSMGPIASTSGTERTRDLALCAVLLDEWLKELAAVAQEQSIALFNAGHI